MKSRRSPLLALLLGLTGCGDSPWSLPALAPRHPPLLESPRCFHAGNFGSSDGYLWLREDGSYLRVEVDRNPERQLDWLDSGRWLEDSPTEFTLWSDREVQAFEMGELRVSPDLATNLGLVPRLRAELATLLARDRRRSFPEDEIREIRVDGELCPEEDGYLCCGSCEGPRRFCLTVETGFDSNEVPREELARFVDALEGYGRRTDLGVFHLELATESGWTVAVFKESGVARTIHRDPRKALDGLRIDSLHIAGQRSPVEVDPEDDFSVLVQTSCADLAPRIATLGIGL